MGEAWIHTFTRVNGESTTFVSTDDSVLQMGGGGGGGCRVGLDVHNPGASWGVFRDLSLVGGASELDGRSPISFLGGIDDYLHDRCGRLGRLTTVSSHDVQVLDSARG